MNINKWILIITILVVVGIGARMGYQYYERQHTEDLLVGYWQQENPWKTITDQSNDGADDAPMSTTDDDDVDDGGVRVPIQAPELVKAVQDALAIKTQLHFEEDGLFTISSGDKDSTGRWVLSQAMGKKKTVVARVMQTPTFEQRLIIHLQFDGPDTLIISDEAGVQDTFHRVQPESSSAQP